ncbi:MAG TPA: S8 family serine peptidase [Burkholderiaceae bacterium]|nr:S8 family serine peptidase [Burkholderiaceae bacterium]
MDRTDETLDGMRLAAVAVTTVLVGVFAAPAPAIDCAPQPADPVGASVRAVKADQVSTPATTPPIAVLDSGLAAVPELTGRIKPGYNPADGSQNTTDTDGHGTAVASIAAAAAGGVRGVSPTSPVIPIKIFDSLGNTTEEALIDALERATDMGARVINISSTAPAGDINSEPDTLVRMAINLAVSDGALVIAPTGNEGGAKLDIPAIYPHVIAVGATDASNARAPFSNAGNGIDLVAPGTAIVTAAPKPLCSSGYQIVEGTSFSAPAVAGAAALLLQHHPKLDPAQATDMLRLRGLRRPAPGWSVEMGFGLLDVAAVLNAPVPAADQPEVDDDITFSKLHAPVLKPSRRSRQVKGRVATHTDPADVLRVQLKKGDRLRAKLKAGAGATLKMRLSDGRRALTSGRSISYRVKRPAVYYVSITVTKTPPAGADYTLSLKR